MKFLRDDSGQVLVFPGLFGAHGRTRAAERSNDGTNKPEVSDKQRSVLQAKTPHCCFYCRWCEAPLALPHNSMGMMFGQPAVRRIEARSIATACSACGHVGDYSLFRACHGFDTRYKIQDVETKGKTVLVDWLHCEEPTCTARVPFFLTLEQPVEEVEGRKIVKTWQWEDVYCASGHPIVPATLKIWEAR